MMRPLQDLRHKLWSLRFRIVLSIVGIEILMLSILVWSNALEVERTHSLRLVQSSKVILQQFTNTVGRHIIAADYASLSEYANAVLEHDELEYIHIEDNTGRAILTLGPYPETRQLNELPQDSTDGVFDLAAPIDFGDKVRGTVSMGFSLALMEATVWQAVRRGASIALVEVILSIGAALMLGFVLTRNLRSLSDAVVRFSSGESDISVPVRGEDEIAQLTHAFNTMVRDKARDEAALRDNEEQLRRLNQELEQRVEARTAELQKINVTLLRKERLAAIGELTATVAHELRNPLGAVRSGITVITKLSDPNNPVLERAIKLVNRSEMRCNKIVTDLLNFARTPALEKTTTHFDNWLSGLLNDHAWPAGIERRFDLQAGVEAQFDRNRLQSAIENVIDNACQALDDDRYHTTGIPDRKIRVQSQLADGRLEIIVTDNGPGIADTDLSEVFEPLFSTKSIGTGLGLSIVKQVLDQHEGGIEVSSEPDVETKITLWIPHKTENKNSHQEGS